MSTHTRLSMGSGKSNVYIDTSGWSYAHWKGRFYPTDITSEEMLGFYCRYFQSVEINNTFYHLPDHATLEHWRDNTPANFVFSVKASRYITHMKKLTDPRQSLGILLDRVGVIGNKLGPILFQLPPRWRYNQERLSRFLGRLRGQVEIILPTPRACLGHQCKARFAGNGCSLAKKRNTAVMAQVRPNVNIISTCPLSEEFSYAFEFRDHSWLNEQCYELPGRHGAAACIYELDGFLSPHQVTGNFVYLRLHGPGGPYQGNYTPGTLADWAKAISSWSAQHKSVYCYFDNDEAGYAAKNAMELQEMLGP